MSENIIYKICSKEEWDIANEKGAYTGSADDIRDGFIHFSSKEQVAGTLAKHFIDIKNLLLLSIDADLLPSGKLKWEVSRNNQKFPHLYDDLNLDAVINIENIPDDR
ncbi:DUF952 domain-containing protein [Pseudemcibacter aquimaris]|uniref:DUF952 domain-containing protein n=1 Tax=Pseudemcibacter aquimaris TaxID=2857064 RepID=UPI00201377DC|nr:DUF952 domain-containing protein [Pseudemcibacter aquimaris]MCC3862345.1 DUF952 domain-containing protein [Pseudemcibacter aquimaris]WDU59224.1 DUF952 domain-containing protein [Pseudemcibacter aquimaris]